jgi:hypothetical protein
MAAEKVTSVVVAIDTNEYSGNFEREMCAFITGQIGECGVGDRLILEAREELAEDTFNNTLEWIEESIVQESDDNGCYRPCSIWPTPGWYNNGMGGHYKDEPVSEEQALKDNYEALVNYTAGQLAMVTASIENNDFEDSSKPGAWDKAACIRTKNRIDKELAEAKAKVKVNKWPAYMSVAIFFEEVPPKEVMDVIIERAKRFAEERPDWRSYKGEKKPLMISAIRVLEPTGVKKRQVIHTEVARYEV